MSKKHVPQGVRVRVSLWSQIIKAELDCSAFFMYLCNMEKERQENILSKIESMRKGVKMMYEGGDIKHLAKMFLLTDLDSLELQVNNINKPYEEIEK